MSAASLASCKFGPPKYQPVRDEYVYTTLSFSPVTATDWALTRFASTNLAELLDNFSDAELRRQRRFYEEFREGLKRVAVDRLVPEDRADHDLIQHSISRALNAPPRHRDDPSLYSGILLRGIRPSAATDERQRNIDAFHTLRRLEAVPKFLKQAAASLTGGTAAQIARAKEQLAQFAQVVDGSLRRELQGDLAPAYTQTAPAALDAARAFSTRLDSLPLLSAVLGAEAYRKLVPDGEELASFAAELRGAVAPELRVQSEEAAATPEEIRDFFKRVVPLGLPALDAASKDPYKTSAPSSLRFIATAALKWYSDRIEPHSRRVLRSRDGDASLRAGWEEYLVLVAAEEASPFRRAYLRDAAALATAVEQEHAIHTGAAAPREIVPEAGAATGRLRGLRDMAALREASRQAKGKGFLLPDFHGQVLAAGPLPAPILCRLLTGAALPPVSVSQLVPAAQSSKE